MNLYFPTSGVYYQFTGDPLSICKKVSDRFGLTMQEASSRLLAECKVLKGHTSQITEAASGRYIVTSTTEIPTSFETLPEALEAAGQHFEGIVRYDSK